jgi:peptidoglycan/LPS O-acetylase OafA/YrhL
VSAQVVEQNVVDTGKKHLASLDSLRGIGLILIFADHFIFPKPYIQFGWIGLWTFFVLSGYLITEGLLKMRTLPLGQYFGRFYLKRAFRILPAFLVFFPIAVALYFAFPRWLAFGSNLGHYWINIVTFTFNQYQLRSVAAGGFWFAHLWSLSVEEQFYVIWPLLIFFLPMNWLKKVVPAWIILAPVLRLIVPSLHGASLARAPIIADSSLLCQADAFAIGGCVAIFRHQLPHLSKKLLWIATIALIAIGLVNYFAGASVAGSYWRTLGWPYHLFGQFNYQYVWGYSVINIWAATLILACLQGAAPAILNFSPFVFFGRISYGAYLFHGPLLGVYFYYLRPINAFSVRGLVIFLIWFANVILVSWLSFRFIEVWFLRFKNRLGGKQRLPIRTEPFPELPTVKRSLHE